MLSADTVVTLVARSICPDFLARPMLHIVLPIAFVAGSIHVSIDTVSICLIFKPLAFKYVTVYVPEFSPTARLIIPPETLVPGAIRPDLHTEAMFHVA